MLQISKRDIRQGYKGIKHLAKKAFKKGDVEKSLEYVNNCVTIAQQFNFIYSDYELEDLLKQIGEKVLPEPPKDYEPIKDRVVFFDDFCRSFVLALQYLDALLAAGKEILYITSKDVEIDSKLFYIVDAVKSRNIEVCIISHGKKNERYKEIFDTIINFRPEKILLHIYANSVSIPVI